MIKIALLTCATWDGLLEKEMKMAEEMAQFNANWTATPVVWNDPDVDWKQFDVLLFRTIWDYYMQPVAFEKWLKKIARLGIKTLNTVDTIYRNHHKFYLKELENKGVHIIPTQFFEKGTTLDLTKVGSRGWKKAIIKPAISAASHETTLFETKDLAVVQAKYEQKLLTEDVLLQPFFKEIKTSGEISLIFFNKIFSHAIVKRPVKGDFRIQVQFGGKYQPYTPDLKLLATAQQIVNTFTTADLLYARVDGILKNGKFYLMELELIEPDLYFDYSEGAKKRYFEALKTLTSY